jgi:Cu+-exporting ATPase
MAMAIDPVCGMEVDPQQAAGTSEYQSTTYYFCSPGCKRQFDKDPEQYVGQQATQDTGD